MLTETLIVEEAGGAATITLNRPEMLNAWNRQLGIELRRAVGELGADPAIRAVLITGAGRAFSSGADLSVPPELDADGLPDLSADLRELFHPIIIGIREMPKPVVAAVNGPAVGIGCSLALATDLVLAGDSAYFLLAFVNIGLVPDGGSSAFVPDRIGVARASDMMLLGERIPAMRALDWGLINRVVPDDQLRSEADALVGKLATGPTEAYAKIKTLLNRRAGADLRGQLDAEADLQRVLGLSPDFLEGAAAFAEKREPKFSGQ